MNIFIICLKTTRIQWCISTGAMPLVMSMTTSTYHFHETMSATALIDTNIYLSVSVQVLCSLLSDCFS